MRFESQPYIAENPGANRTAHCQGSAGGGPVLFRYSALWQNDQPLLDVMRELYGDRPLDSLGGSYGWPVRYRQVEDYDEIGIHTVAEYIERFREGGHSLPYLRHLSLNRGMPLLRQWIHDPEAFRPNWVSHPGLDRLGGPELFLGQAGTVFGHVHQDQVGVHVGFVQLQGEKEIVLFPPEDAPYLYTMPGAQFPWQMRNSRVRYRDLENFAEFPLLKKARRQHIIMRAGEAMVLPANWWHTTRNLSDSVSYNIRIVNRSNALNVLGHHLAGIPRAFRRYLMSSASPRL